MDDRLLNALHQAPPSAFAEQLRQRLADTHVEGGRARHAPIRRLVTFAAAAALVALIVSVPAVRASAASFLALFRVANFVAVEVDPSRFEALKTRQLDLRTLIGENVEIIQDVGPPLAVVSLEQAAAAAGYALKLPSWLPDDARIIEMSVSNEGVARVTANATRLQEVMRVLGITDLEVPDGLDGQIVTVRVPRIVMVRWEHGRLRTRFFQAPAPQVTLPQGVDLKALGEIGLRIVGLPPREAREFAGAVDWTSTLILPLPPGVTSMKRVDINGNPGLVVQHNDPSPTTMVLWAADDRVFGVVTLLGLQQALEMAYSVR